ncbi:hypothetical protein J2S62_002174 [Enteractinococcus fodinae]|uniref:Uncharacterized protein n=1 Tax=Enteractinococcus fodinae TaxID=684663 RepID=A0ABU2B2U3_9MICC|nr:hypothetical protein [Enteractinococcus fodinae]
MPTFMAEYAQNKRRGFFGSFLEFGTISGYAVGAALMLFLETILTSRCLPGAGVYRSYWHSP